MAPTLVADGLENAVKLKESAAEAMQFMTLDPVVQELDRLSVKIPDGELHLFGQNILNAPRCSFKFSDPVACTEPTMSTDLKFKLDPATIGTMVFEFSWRPGGGMLATTSSKDGQCTLSLWTPDGALFKSQGIGQGTTAWMGWNPSGDMLAVRKWGLGIFLWVVAGEKGEDTADTPMILLPRITKHATHCSWSKVKNQLIIGTSDGKVLIFTHENAVLQAHELTGEFNGSSITCGDWAFDNSVMLGCGARFMKLCKAIAEEGPRWTTHSQFDFSQVVAKMPSQMLKTGKMGDVRLSLGFPPLAATKVDSKYLVIADTSWRDEDLCFSFPDDYGDVISMEWLFGDMLVVLLSFGYAVCISIAELRANQDQATPRLSDAPEAVCSYKLFDRYVGTCAMANSKQHLVVCGSTFSGEGQVKVLQFSLGSLQAMCAVTLEWEVTTGEQVTHCAWDSEGAQFTVGTSDGHLWTYGTTML